MKTQRGLALTFTLLALFAFLFNGCTSAAKQHLRVLPDGEYKSVKATITGKFSSTTIDGTDVSVKAGELKAGKLHLRHSNVYIPLIELELEAQDSPAK